jgi:predicted Abi (CAAX) family protease
MNRLKHLLAALFILTFLAGAAVSSAETIPAPDSVPDVVIDQPSAQDASGIYKPIGEWTGRLILPKHEQREADGSVFIKVANSPHGELIGRTIRLRWNTSNEEDRWFETIRPDLKFTEKNLKKAAADGILEIIPIRLDGWARVSPLESLAGARVADDVEVLLKNAVYRDGSVYINEDPVQISGSHAALVKFTGPAHGNHRTVVHYNRATGLFDGPTETIYLLSAYKISLKNKLVSSTVDIEKNDINEKGFYIYGVFMNNGNDAQGRIFVVKALMPRSLHLLEAAQWTQGKTDIKHYFAKRHFKDLVPRMHRSTIVIPEQSAETLTPQIVSVYINNVWPVGARCLLVHVFGWRKNLVTGSTDLPGPQCLHAGHFAFGIAEVISDPFTGEKRFDIEYKQIYAHGDGGIVAGTMKWHNYMGDIKRGWMYTVPVSDTMIQIPEMLPYDINGWRIDPLRGFSRLTEIMMAVYRTGGGRGISNVTPYISCVQDSHYALYGSLMTFEKEISSDPRCLQWLSAAGKTDPEALRFKELSGLVKAVKDRITIIGLARHDWKRHFDDPLGTREPWVAAQLVRTLLSLKTVFPRDAHDNIMFLGANRQYRMWSVVSAMCGGSVPELWPLPPNSLVIK